MADGEVVVLFPGQGAFDGAALALANRAHPQVAQTFKAVDQVSVELYGRPVSDLVLDGEVEIGRLLDDEPWVSQLAIYATSLAAYRVLADHGLRPDVLAGHSLGEITALVAAGAFSVEDGARIVATRVAVIAEQDGTDGRMVALGVDARRAAAIVDLIADPLLAVATENHDQQTVLSGPAAAVERVVGIAGHLQVGAVELRAPFPFHTPALAPAAPVFAARIRDLTQHALEIPVYSPILERYYEPTDDLGALLAEHFVRPVRFASAVRALREAGGRHFVEAGGKAALTTAVRKLLGEEVTAGASFTTDRDGALALHGTLIALRGAGLADGVAGGLREVLAPGVAQDVFERFWVSRGAEVVALAGTLLAEFTAAAPVAVAAPVVVEVDRDAVAATVRLTYATALEYPEEVFTEDVLLEAELGVDSVKQVELLTRVSQQYGLPPRGSDFRLADYDTMGKIVDFVLTHRV
ncbi:acyltransferase domain-containing protein [Actinosynnema sp. NPDC020468]|uniref:acyltransferase domain-containing protein n=1 Tax=Actinosynnema sp. NPDC020468 TaxID=3154488 RepID=UPI0033E878FA